MAKGSRLTGVAERPITPEMSRNAGCHHMHKRRGRPERSSSPGRQQAGGACKVAGTRPPSATYRNTISPSTSPSTYAGAAAFTRPRDPGRPDTLAFGVG